MPKPKPRPKVFGPKPKTKPIEKSKPKVSAEPKPKKLTFKVIPKVAKQAPKKSITRKKFEELMGPVANDAVFEDIQNVRPVFHSWVTKVYCAFGGCRNGETIYFGKLVTKII